MRKILPQMTAYLDDKLKENWDAKYAIKHKLPRFLMVEAAKACIGIKELTGDNDGPLIELIQKTVGNKAHNEPYCMSFVQTILAYTELKTGIKSNLFATEHCMTLWRKTPEEMFVKRNPLPGALIMWNKENTDSGHTGIVISSNEHFAMCVEANTTLSFNEGEIQREGGGIYMTKRPRKSVGSMILKGFIKPF